MKTRHDRSCAFMVSCCAAGLTLFCIVLLSSCKAAKQDTRRLSRIQHRNPQLIASACAEYYPIRDSIHETMAYKAGNTITKREIKTVTINCDSIISIAVKNENINTKSVKIPCPRCDSFRIDTLFVTEYKFLRNTAHETELQNKFNMASSVIASKNNTISWLKWLTISGWSILVALSIFKYILAKL